MAWTATAGVRPAIDRRDADGTTILSLMYYRHNKSVPGLIADSIEEMGQRHVRARSSNKGALAERAVRPPLAIGFRQPYHWLNQCRQNPLVVPRIALAREMAKGTA